MRMTALILAALGLVVAPAAAVTIELTTDQPRVEANLALNPAMEEGADGAPAHWSLSTAVPENFETAWVEGEGRHGSRALYLKAHENVMSGYWGQTVAVEPGSYIFRGFYRTTTGRLLMYAHGRNTDVEPPVGVDARVYAGSAIAGFLVPVFIPYEALAGADPDTYYPFSVQVEVPERLPTIALSMGMYFTPGEVWFDDVWFGPATLDLIIRVAGGGEQVGKLTVFDEDEVDPVYVSTNDPRCPVGGLLPDPFEVRLEDVRADARYLIVAKTADGDLTRARFPEEAR